MKNSDVHDLTKGVLKIQESRSGVVNSMLGQGVSTHQDRVNKIFTSKAYEGLLNMPKSAHSIFKKPLPNEMPKPHDRLNHIFKSSAYKGLLALQETSNSILKSSAFEGLLAEQANKNSILKGPVHGGLLAQETKKSILSSPTYEGLLSQQATKNSILKGPMYGGLLALQEAKNSLFNGPVHGGLLSQNAGQGVWFNNLNDGVIKQEESSDVTLKNPLVRAAKVDTVSINRMLEQLEEVYEEIDDLDILDNDGENETEAIKQFLSEVIEYCRYYSSFINTVDSKVVWDILSKISVLVTILLAIPSVGSEEDNRVINVNGKNLEIHIHDGDTNPVILNINGVESEQLNESEVNPIEELEKLDFDAGKRT
jgi:hypothetical protein